MSAMEDMFGHVPQRGELFAEPMELTPPIQHTPETIRARMLEILGEAKAAETMPWTPRIIRSHTAMFPYMAEWLDEREGKQLLLDLKTEMDRLGASPEEVAPNWRAMWNLAA
ncbi:MAG TPA: hypothetical protein VK403_00545 [Allosphingosinicella sp.]|nr:hypothetical protein [Allosphingosinicella sp.]